MNCRRAALLAAIFLAVLATSLTSGYLVAAIWSVVVEGQPSSYFSVEHFGQFLASVIEFDGRSILFLVAAIHAAAVVALLAPVVLRPKVALGARSLRASIAAACVLGGLATFMGFAAIAEGALAAFTLFDDPASKVTELGGVFVHPIPLFGGWAVSGALWAFVLARLGLERHPAAIDRIFRLAFAATAIEAVLAVPIYLLLRRRATCECALASFIGLVCGVAALVALCGPWALLFLTRRVRRNWQRAACPACGYPRRTAARTCSECGQALGSDEGAPASG